LALPNFGGGPSKIVPTLSPLPRGKSSGKKILEDTPTSPEVIEAHMLNFMANFKFLPRPDSIGAIPRPDSTGYGVLLSIDFFVFVSKITRKRLDRFA